MKISKNLYVGMRLVVMRGATGTYWCTKMHPSYTKQNVFAWIKYRTGVNERFSGSARPVLSIRVKKVHK